MDKELQKELRLIRSSINFNSLKIDNTERSIFMLKDDEFYNQELIMLRNDQYRLHKIELILDGMEMLEFINDKVKELEKIETEE